MAITKISKTEEEKDTLDVFEDKQEVVVSRFTIESITNEIQRLNAQITELEAKKAAAEALK